MADVGARNAEGAQTNAGRRREIYYFRDQQGLEIDFIVRRRGGTWSFVEAKATATPMPRMAEPMRRLAAAWSAPGRPRRRLDMTVVHWPRQGGEPSRALAPGVQAVPWLAFVTELLP